MTDDKDTGKWHVCKPCWNDILDEQSDKPKALKP